MAKSTEQFTEVDGFVFTDEVIAQKAQKELEGIRYIKTKTDMDNPDMVLEIYNRMIDEKLFETPVGYAFLKELQEYLVTIPYIRTDQIKRIQVDEMIPVKETLLAKREEKRQQAKEDKPKRQVELHEKNVNYKTRYRTFLTMTIALAVIVAAMFAITLTSGSPTVLNYETNLINKYEHWEEDLQEREAQLDQREIDLQNRENQ